MPRVIVAPSVLAADMGNLNQECKRMMDAGADWLHMGELVIISVSIEELIKSLQRCHGRSFCTQSCVG